MDCSGKVVGVLRMGDWPAWSAFVKAYGDSEANEVSMVRGYWRKVL